MTKSVASPEQEQFERAESFIKIGSALLQKYISKVSKELIKQGSKMTGW